MATPYNIKVNGEHINCTSVSMSIDEESFCWNFSASLPNFESFILCSPGSTFVVRILDTYYTFIIDVRERSTTAAGSNFSCTGRSPTGVLGEGATPVHKTWDTTMAKDIVLELAGDITCNYLVENWSIPNGIFEADGELPIALIKTIIEIPGGIIYTDAIGALFIVKKHKVIPPEYDLGTVDFSISSYDDILELSETKVIQPNYNKVEVSSEPISDTISISIEEVELIETSATIRVNVYPFVTSIVLHHSRGIEVVIDADVTNPIIEEQVDDVEFVDGVAATTKLVKSITSIEYQHNDLGDITSDGTTIASTIKGNGLAVITYDTEFHLFEVISQDSEKIQVYTEDS